MALDLHPWSASPNASTGAYLRHLVVLLTLVGPLLVTFKVRAAELKVEPLRVALKQLTAASRFLPLRSDQPLDFEPAGLAVPDDFKIKFLAIERAMFGREDLITLKTCAACFAQSDAGTMTTYLQPERILQVAHDQTDGNPNPLIEFILAHELAHFALDELTLMSGTALSPNGNIPLLIKGMYDFVDPQITSQLTTDKQRQVALRFLRERAAPAHAEVDLIAILTLNGMGIDARPSARRLMEHFAQGSDADEGERLDMQIRLAALLAKDCPPFP